ncbi:hypothetical protein CBR_g44287 [Chara braunii]|uniref:Integrase zinc-binding domain-containing protein n=1 Tax=Chara braunii TaxID=69332 RepID=A0A388K387_CHABU|nr:hypothetical protein CBR_g44287 [Chara braunii]|eukprot:GBG64403.1 hypothetical protein CBR_g44287 [Chara braunii]
MSQGGGASGGPKKGLTLDDLIAAIDQHERNPSNITKVDTFHFCGERVPEWLERVEQALVGRSDVVKFQRILQYVLHSYHQEVKKVIDAAQGSWERFKEGMQRKYRLGDGLLTTADLEAMNKEDFTTIGAFVQEFKKRARKVHGISEEAQCAIFLGLLTASEAVELTRHGGGSTKLTWATIDRGVEVGCLDQVEQRQVRLQRQKRKEKDATASGTPGVTRIVTYVLAQLGSDGIAGGHRGIQATYAKISELYYWDGMMDMAGKFCRSCVPCQERSSLRQGEPLHPRLEQEVGVVVHLDLLFMPLGDQGYNYIFDARDNLSGFVDGHVIRIKTRSVLVSCIEEYYLRYPFVREFVMDRGSEFTCQEVQELLSRSDFTKTAMPRGGKGTRPPQRPLGASGGYERHGPRHRESTSVYNDGDIELFLDSFWEHARHLEEPALAEPRQEPCQPEKEMEAEIPKRVDLRTRERAPAGEIAEEKRARRTRRIDEIWQERQRLEAAGELPTQQQERQRSEAAGTLPGQPPSAPARAPEIPEMWRDFWEQRGEELPSPVRVGFGVARKAEERLDRKIKFLAKTTFGRHWLLAGDLAGKKIKEASHGVRLEAMEMEIQELRALVTSQAAIIESLRQQTQGKVDKPGSSRQGEQRHPGHGLPGQPSAAEPRQEPPMGRVILEPEEARAQRQAERKAFEFRAPTELATLPVAAAGRVVPLAVEEGLPPSGSEPAQGSAEGSMGVLLEAVHTMKEEVSLFSPEQRIEEPLERKMGIEAEGVIEGGLQRLGTPEYGPEEIEEQPMTVPGETLERRPQRLGTPEYVPATGDLRSRLGSLATRSGSGGPVPGMEQQEVVRTATPRSEQQGVVSTLVGSPSSPPPQPRKKKFKRKVDQLCFYCKRDVHHTLDCLEFLEDKAEGKVSEAGGKMYDREGRIVKKFADGLKAQLYRQKQEELRR